MLPLLVTRAEACKRLGISRPTFDRQRAAGRLPHPWSPRRYVWDQIVAAVNRDAGAEPAKPDKTAAHV